MVKTIKDIFTEAASLNDYLSSRGINPKFVSRDTKISHAKSAEFQKWKNDRKMTEEIVTEASEAELLAKYLNSRGINAKYATKDMKIAHSKSGEFQKWKRDHQHLELSEETDKKDMVCFDIPLLIRVLEFTREDMKTDIELHNMVERLINMRETYPLTMKEYDAITSNLVKEEVLDEVKKPRTTALEKWRKAAKERENKHNQTPTGDMKGAIDRLEKHLNKEEVEQIDEISKSTLSSYKDKSSASLKNAQANRDAAEPGKDMSKGFADLHAKSNKIAKNRVKGLIGYMQRKQGMKPTSENTLDSMAATEAPCDCSDNTNSTPTTGKSYAAKMVKGLKKTVKEETYDWEKDDKSSQEKSYGKAPKMNVTDKTGTLGDTKPEARAVMKGGKTLTGQPRDMVEIDPSMKQRPGQQDKGQNTFTNPIAKKSPNFN